MANIMRLTSLASVIVIFSSIGARAADCPNPLPAEMSKDQLRDCLLEISHLRADLQRLQALQTEVNDKLARPQRPLRFTAESIDPGGAPGKSFFAGGWRPSPNDQTIPNSDKYAFCSISGVYSSQIRNVQQAFCELHQDQSKGSKEWTIKVGPSMWCQVTCFKIEADN